MRPTYKNIEILDYDSMEEHGEMGIYFYGEKIYPYNLDELKGVKSYKIQVFLSETTLEDKLQNLDPSIDRNEIFSFVVTTDLSKYVVFHKYEGDEWSEPHTVQYFNYLQILKDSEPELLEFFVDRQKRKSSKLIVEPKYSKNKEEYLGITEILELDENSSFYGDFVYDNKRYVKVFVKRRERPLKLIYKIPDVIEWFDVPSQYRSDNSDLVEFSKIDRENQEKIVARFLERNILSLKEGESAPFQIRLVGNDDDSWSKHFYSEEDLQKELSFLRKMQPISKQYDVINRGYYFTN